MMTTPATKTPTTPTMTSEPIPQEFFGYKQVKYTMHLRHGVWIAGRHPDDTDILAKVPPEWELWTTPSTYADTCEKLPPHVKVRLFAFHEEDITKLTLKHEITHVTSAPIHGPFITSSISAMMALVGTYNAATEPCVFFSGTLFTHERPKQLLSFLYWLGRLEAAPHVQEVYLSPMVAKRLEGVGYLTNYSIDPSEGG